MTRILFRSGPDALNGVDAGSAFFLSVVGRINLTLEQLLLFAFMVILSLGLLWDERQSIRAIGLMLFTILVCSAALYAPLPAELAWAVSVMLIAMVASVVPFLAYRYFSSNRHMSSRLRLSLTIFLGSLTLSFVFPLYYRMYYLLGAVNIVSLPFPLEVYLAGVFALIATTLAAFSYAVQAPSPGFGFGPRNALKTVFLPTILVVPMLYEFLTSFFAIQIFGMVLTMSTDLAASHNVIEGLIAAFWFLLAAILILVFKGRHSNDRMQVQQAMGLVLLMSTTMLFNYPYYMMLGIAGVILICIPLSETWTSNIATTR